MTRGLTTGTDSGSTGSTAAQKRPRRSAFTLVELLVVLAVISLLMAMLLPGVARARAQAKQTQCLSQLRQLGLAALAYTVEARDSFPIAVYQLPPTNGVTTVLGWDFNVVRDWNRGGAVDYQPGLLWQFATNLAVQQCPAFEGDENWAGEPFTGYNYNTSYIGSYRPAGISTPAIAPARTGEIRRPGETALFGDGEYAAGANKFMRSPWLSPRDTGFGSGRYAGTQGFRHLETTDVAFVDGHATAWRARCVATYPDEAAQVALGTGFLSETNALYDLD